MENISCAVLLEQKINKQTNDFGNRRVKKKRINKRIIKQKKKHGHNILAMDQHPRKG